MIIDILKWLCSICLGIGTLYGLYQLFISLHMFGNVRPPYPVANTNHRFAIMICAKNEAKVINKLIDSLKNQNYPSEAFDIFVTADNCSDDTAAVSRAAGAIVYERFDSEHQSKGYALNWTFEHFLKDYGGCYDACVIFDADNIAHPGFLDAMNRQLNAGRPIATGYRMGKNPSSSWVAGCSSLFWLMQTRSLFVPRDKLRLPCLTVGGTGFMFRLSLLGKTGWQTRSVCEDIEFSLNSIAEGHFIAFAPDALFYDEQPLTFAQSIKQRYRWSLGSLQVLSISTPRLWRSFLSGTRKVLDAILYSMGVVVTGVTTICWVLFLALNAMASRDWGGVLISIGTSAVSGYLTLALIACLMLFLEKKSWPGAWKAVLTYPVFMVSWAVINVIVLFYRNSAWKSIPHTESLDIGEAEGKYIRNGSPRL